MSVHRHIKTYENWISTNKINIKHKIAKIYVVDGQHYQDIIFDLWMILPTENGKDKSIEIARKLYMFGNCLCGSYKIASYGHIGKSY